ncbi:hypothetical protein J5N97_001045 [Dioscorea zingiberensis]|uniref:Autophagy-related protein 13 N-terminal domain-containing protein n=1 Tax=Dioscorea zingiberensis TaxID=325984 RepID=A0A9D5BUW5_9LILI|nr:hypothetical protein J5N97_001045 [Dioscorea zingiberensis]
MFVDILLSSFESLDPDPDAVIERWILQFQPSSSSSSSSSSLSGRIYKKTIVLLRSLYSLLRFLPAFRVFRTLCASNQSYNYGISYKVSSFAEPFSRDEERAFKPYSFTAVETPFGQLSVSVMYRTNLSGFNFEVSSLIPPMMIDDYVGSPAAEPMRAFPSSPSARSLRATSFPSRAGSWHHPPSLTRPHSWTSAPLAHHPLSSSPVSEVSPPEVYGHPRTVSLAQAQPPAVYRKGGFGIDEFRLSPPLSLSPSPSPPTHGGNPLHSRLRSDTAPVSIPQAHTGKNRLHRSPNFSDPTRNFLPPPSPRSVRGDPSSQDSLSDSRSFRKLEGFSVGNLNPNLHWYATQKGLKDAKDDSGRFSGVFSSSGSPRFGFSRSSSRLSIQDDLEDGDFSCPFAVDDVDTSDSQTRDGDVKEGPSSMSSRRSQDAAVGDLVHMFKTAAPLQQDLSYSSPTSKPELNTDVAHSSFFTSRRASDALEELRSYREIKDMLLSRSRSQLPESENQTTN